MSTVVLSVEQRMQVQRAVRANKVKAAREEGGELNVIPFLDIVMNVLMFVLATSATVFTSTITPTVPGCCGSSRAPDVPTLHVTPGGYVVGSRAGFVAADCRSMTTGGAVTVPLRDGRHDAASLGRCLAALHADPASPAAFRAQRALQVSAVGSVPYQELVRALDAARETRPGAGDLFPEVTLGLLR